MVLMVVIFVVVLMIMMSMALPMSTGTTAWRDQSMIRLSDFGTDRA